MLVAIVSDHLRAGVCAVFLAGSTNPQVGCTTCQALMPVRNMSVWPSRCGRIHMTYRSKSFQTQCSRFPHAIISSSVGSLNSSSGESGATGAGGNEGGGGGGGGCWPRILKRTTRSMKDARTLAANFRRGMHIWILDGFRQISYLAGVQLGGGVSGSWNG